MCDKASVLFLLFRLPEGTQDGIQMLSCVQQPWGLRRSIQEVPGTWRPHGDASRPQGAGGPRRLRQVILPPGELARLAGHQRPAIWGHVPFWWWDTGPILPVAQTLPVQPAGRRETRELCCHVVRRRRLVGPLLRSDHELSLRVWWQGGTINWTLFNSPTCL